jgi:hypothetical protein
MRGVRYLGICGLTRNAHSEARYQQDEENAQLDTCHNNSGVNQSLSEHLLCFKARQKPYH